MDLCHSDVILTSIPVMAVIIKLRSVTGKESSASPTFLLCKKIYFGFNVWYTKLGIHNSWGNHFIKP